MLNLREFNESGITKEEGGTDKLVCPCFYLYIFFKIKKLQSSIFITQSWFPSYHAALDHFQFTGESTSPLFTGLLWI